MNNQNNNLKALFLRGVKAFGQTASNLATNAQTKLNQMNLEARRREILTEIPNLAMQLWIDGMELPTALTDLLGELTEVDEKLLAIQTQKYKQTGVAEDAWESISEDAAPEESTSEETPVPDAADAADITIIAESTAVNSASAIESDSVQNNSKE